MIRAIAAIDDKNGIAANGGIPWKIPEDTKYFREQTEHGSVLMGEVTYAEFAEPLPNRRNLVASKNLHEVRAGFELAPNVEALLTHASEDVWVIGGAGLFASTLQYCEELYVTRVEGDFKCDRFFPIFTDEFLLDRESPAQTSGEYRYTFQVYKRK